MIQPLSQGRSEWVIRWVEIDEVVLSEEGEAILPVFQVITDERGVPLDVPEMVPELDQDRLEETLEKLFEQEGKPGRLVVGQSEDWDEGAWKGFGLQHEIGVKFRDLREEMVLRFHDLREALSQSGDVMKQQAERMAFLLKEKSMELRSMKRREAYLRKALELLPTFSGARVELADLEFTRGEWKKCLSSYETVLRDEKMRLGGRAQQWWADHGTRPYLMAHFGKGMTFWHQGKYAEAVYEFQNLLFINEVDHQGARFYIPMLLLLQDRNEEAAQFFDWYEKKYAGDFIDPAMYFGWGLMLSLSGEEGEAMKKYQLGMIRNIYMAPMILEEKVPSQVFWHPNNRAEPAYAEEFIDTYAPLWDRESGSLRMLREAWEEIAPRIQEIVLHRRGVADFQDQRYDRAFRVKWEQMMEEDMRLSTTLPEIEP